MNEKRASMMTICLLPESGVKIARSELDWLQSAGLSHDAIGQILYER